MAELKKTIVDEKNGLTYTLHGDYYLPELGVPSERHFIGKYGCMRLEYLKEHRPGLFTRLIVSGELDAHLEETNERAKAYLDQMISQMAQAEGATEQMKARDQLGWIGLMNNIKARAEEMVLSELIYA